MIRLNISQVKNFMEHLLIKDTFDAFYLNEATVNALCSFSIDGTKNAAYDPPLANTFVDPSVAASATVQDAAQNAASSTEYVKWRDVKPLVLSMIKGKATPTSMKIIFSLTPAQIISLIQHFSLDFKPEQIDALAMNFRFNKEGACIITGTSLKTFSMEKSLEKTFDAWVRDFLAMKEIAFKED